MIALGPLLDIYSIALLTSMILTATALVVAAVQAVGRGRRLSTQAGQLCLVAFGFAVFALSFHFRMGHPQGTAEALSAPAFLGDHRAMAFMVVLTAVLAATARRAALR